MHLNKNQKLGHLAADPQYTEHQSDPKRNRCWFRIGVNRPKSKHVDFFSVVCWGALADAVAKYCSQGKQVLVEGQDRTRSEILKIDDKEVMKDGKPVRLNYQEIVASNVSFGQDSKKKQLADAAAAGMDVEALVAAQVAAALAKQGEASEAAGETGEDCPFETDA